MKKINMLNYPLTWEAHREMMGDYGFDANKMGALPLAHRVIDYAMELENVEIALQRMTEERDMLLQRVECLRPKHPACSCKPARMPEWRRDFG